MIKELEGTLERIRTYQELVPEQILTLGADLSPEELEAQKFALYITMRRTWAKEWLRLWTDARMNPENPVYTLTWFRSHYADLAYILKDSLTESTFMTLTSLWESVR